MSRFGKFLKRHVHQVEHPVATAKHQAKSVTRGAARVLVKAGPAIVGVGAGVLSYLFTPAAGAALTALASVDARYGAGKVAARDKGLHGRDANAYARALEKKVAIAGAIGTASGTLTAVITSSGFAASAATEAAAPAVSTPAAEVSSVNAVNLPTLPGAVQGPAEFLPSGGVEALQAAQQAAVANGAQAFVGGAAAGAGSGVLSTLGSVGSALLAPATSVLTKILTPAKPASNDGGLLDFLAGALAAKGEGGGIPGSGDNSSSGDVSPASRGAAAIPIPFLAAGAAALGISGWLLYKYASKKAV